jgi:DNA-binding transcriptional MerR regulator
MKTDADTTDRPNDDDLPRYSLSELTEEAGVSVRTVRYYIAEGLLPPPAAAGPRSFYTQAHLDRLRLIDRLKTAYLPLKEIRRRLTALDDDEVHRLATHQEPAGPSAATQEAARIVREAASRPPDSAASYIARLLHRPPQASASPTPTVAARRAAPRSSFDPPPEPLAAALDVQSLAEPETAPDLFLTAPALAEALPAPAPPVAEPTATAWRRLPLGDDAELLVREEVYQRKRDRIDWLVGWARKVFG